MDVYADHLAAGLANEQRANYQFEEYSPRIARWVSALPVDTLHRMRIARYLGYPSQAWRRRGDLNHVIDQGYGHLIWVLGANRTIITVHDLIPLLLWKGAIRGLKPDRRHPLAELSLRALRRACHLIANSENTKRDLVRHLGCDAERISVIYMGIDSSFKPCTEEDRNRLRQRLRLPCNGSYLVLASVTTLYKNEETSLAVVKRLQEICSRPVVLVRLGPMTETWRENVRISGMRERVVEITWVPRIGELYNAVDCILFPSWYEGLGLPPMEAMACGTPAVTSNAPALPEWLGNAALMAAPDDVESLADAVCVVLENPARRREQIAKGLSRASQFTWERNIQQTLRVYEEVLRREMTNE
jgi:glycosyltransferase involved in cell wall biosynthesis